MWSGDCFVGSFRVDSAERKRSVRNVEAWAGKQSRILRAADLGRQRLDLHWAAGQAPTTVSNAVMRAGEQPGILKAADVGRGRKDLHWAAARGMNSSDLKMSTGVVSSSLRVLRRYKISETRSSGPDKAKRVVELPKATVRVRRDGVNRSYQVKPKISAKVQRDMLVAERIQRVLSTTEVINERARKTKVISLL
eukprot:CAMPEP_0184742324 /NCGR_PEP_ID=MMETSP0315-20130426/5277_1 /TAXON_ID=101924 /ORGANISM="Rhodosorus marinus, Strain UTEX LB 2760" /LENGTH=193 /DNA_ID=CAMNT_0027213079 /DNA_START=38 /DNA_END=619 /DNA_ORIENTATION=+